MSTMQIFAELPKMSPADRRRLKQRLLELEAEQTAPAKPPASERGTIWNALMELSGKAEGLPADLSAQHDHYLHGTAKREA